MRGEGEEGSGKSNWGRAEDDASESTQVSRGNLPHLATREDQTREADSEQHERGGFWHRRRREGEIKSAVPKVRAEVYIGFEKDFSVDAEVDRTIGFRNE